MLQAEALGVHLYVVTGGERRDDALAFLRDVWAKCGATLGMTEPVERVGVGADPEGGWVSLLDGNASGARGLLAAQTRPGPGLRQAALRREHDALCVSVMLAPAPAEGLGWEELDAEWSRVVLTAETTQRHGVLGMARLYLARLTEPEGRPLPAPDGPLTTVVQARTPADPAAPSGWQYAGVAVPQGFAVWEASAAHDARTERRLVVVAAHERDPELTAWTWAARSRELPPLARYMLHSAKIRYQLRVWGAAESIGLLRTDTDTAINDLLKKTATAQRGPSSQADLLKASHALVDLQTRERGLVDRATRSREMVRTVEIATANLTALSGDPSLGGPFADDRALAEWFAQRLDDEATYLEAALRRTEQVSALADQIVQRNLQRRQESVNLGLTGVIGAILMSLAAIQSLQYTLPLPGPVKPAVVTALGAIALLSSLVVLRVVVPEQRWSLMLVRLGVGAVGGTLAWVGMATVRGNDMGNGWTWAGAGIGVATGLAAAVAANRERRR